jgi:hypothetical protein
MTQARTPAGSAQSSGAGEYIVDATQIPTALTWDKVPSVTNRLMDGVEVLRVRSKSDASADFVWEFAAKDKGKIEAIRYENGAVAADGTNGWELSFINTDNSSEVVGYFGFGTGTEAAKATDSVAVSASAFAELVNTTAKNFDKGDVIQVTADRDGTTIVGTIEIVVSYGSEGTADD